MCKAATPEAKETARFPHRPINEAQRQQTIGPKVASNGDQQSSNRRYNENFYEPIAG